MSVDLEKSCQEVGAIVWGQRVPRSFCVTPSAPARVGDTSERGQVVLAHPNLLHHCSGAAPGWCIAAQFGAAATNTRCHTRGQIGARRGQMQPGWWVQTIDRWPIYSQQDRCRNHFWTIASVGSLRQISHLECSKRPRCWKDSGAREISLEMWGGVGLGWWL